MTGSRSETATGRLNEREKLIVRLMKYQDCGGWFGNLCLWKLWRIHWILFGWEWHWHIWSFSVKISDNLFRYFHTHVSIFLSWTQTNKPNPQKTENKNTKKSKNIFFLYLKSISWKIKNCSDMLECFVLTFSVKTKCFQIPRSKYLILVC